MASEFVEAGEAVFHFIGHFGDALDDAGERIGFQRGETRHAENREVLRGILVKRVSPAYCRILVHFRWIEFLWQAKR